MCKDDENEQDAKGGRGDGEETDRNKFHDGVIQKTLQFCNGGKTAARIGALLFG